MGIFRFLQEKIFKSGTTPGSGKIQQHSVRKPADRVNEVRTEKAPDLLVSENDSQRIQFRGGKIRDFPGSLGETI